MDSQELFEILQKAANEVKEANKDESIQLLRDIKNLLEEINRKLVYIIQIPYIPTPRLPPVMPTRPLVWR